MMNREALGASLAEPQDLSTVATQASNPESAEEEQNDPIPTRSEEGATGNADGAASVREIYKNSWLKQIPCTEKWAGRIYKPQKPEKFWVVFCVHDEEHAFLEFYENRRSAYSHSPLSSVPLSQCLHISPTIVVQENDHEFAITLQTQVIRLAASTREQMVEWMDTMRNKLRELGILEPKDNLYSKEPILGPRTPTGVSALNETYSASEVSLQEDDSAIQTNHSLDLLSLSRLSLRDPNSPLPPVPRSESRTSLSRSEPTPSSVYLRNPPMMLPTSNIIQSSMAIPALQSMSDLQNVEPSEQVSLNVSATRTVECAASLPEISQASSPHVSSSNPSSPAGTVDNSLYEPLFSSASLDNSLNFTGVSIRNPNYENPPDSQRIFSESPPVLPPRQPNSYKRSSSFSFSINEPSSLGRESNTNNSETSLNTHTEAVNTALVHTRHRMSSDDITVTSTALSNRLLQNQIVSQMNSEEHVPIDISPQSSHQRNPLTNSIDCPFPTDENGRILSLREAQVSRLQSEIVHKSGVRLVVRKRDCVSAVAFVECFKAVWVSGWKQKEHPLLHNAFHIGDRIMSIAGHRIHSVQETLKVIKQQQTVVEFVIRRVPYGKVLAIKREYEGQDLGIVREGGTAEIIEVKPGSLALRSGLPPKAPSVESNTPCSWFLTEINHRPLNLSFKDNEIHDRLNAVGLDISILVQPSDFVKALKKQLKTIRGYKDFLLQ